MTQMLESPAYTGPAMPSPGIALAPVADSYERPALTVLGTLRGLTKGAGPGGEPIVMQSGIPGGEPGH